MTASDACPCQEEPQPFTHYDEVRAIGTDETNGRFGDVTLRRCNHCGCLWLHYLVEFESRSRSGRYFMGLITPDAAETLTAEAAVPYLESLDWHLYGGSFFDGKQGKSYSRIIMADG